jgi:alpha-amylase/alpha-mannosidase (GH57 family)
MENQGFPSPFYTKRMLGYNSKVWWRNNLTLSMQPTEPLRERGAILADGMALGMSTNALDHSSICVPFILSCPQPCHELFY